MRGVTLRVEGIAQGLAVNRQRLILPRVDFVPALQGAVQMSGGDADQDIAEDVLTGHHVTAPLATAPEALAGLRPEALGPVGDGAVAAHAAEDGPGGNTQHGGQTMSPSLRATGIGDLGKEGREGLHLRGGEHDFGISYPVRWGEDSAAQPPPGIGPQGLEEDAFGRLRRGGVAVARAAEPARAPDIHPVGGPIHRPPKTLRVNKGFQEQHAMTEGGLPIAPQTPLAERQNPRPQVENMPVGQDEKAAVVDRQLQAAIALANVPTDPAIACGALQGGGRKAQQGHPSLAPGSGIPQGFADLRQCTQVVILLHQLLVTGLFQGTNRPDNNLAKVQTAPPQRSTIPTLRLLHRRRYRIATGLSRRSYKYLRLIALGGLNKFTLARWSGVWN